jgi:hypothetical protein
MGVKKIIASLTVVATLAATMVSLSSSRVEAASGNLSVIADSILILELGGTQSATMESGTTNTSSLYTTVFAATTSALGYRLTVNASNTGNVNMVSGGNIIRGAATLATPGYMADTTGNSFTWGIGRNAWTNNGGTTGTVPSWSAITPTMPTTVPTIISTTSAPNGASRGNANGYVVRYGLVTAVDQAPGIYTSQVTFTIIGNN